jgi:asparagine synthase (glutamine-hydrolysing)
MCGIAGVFYPAGGKADTAEVRKMCDSIIHRGPDDEGIHVDGPVGIGMRRLSIIDLSSGHQPIHNEAGTVWVVFNGEIYNYRQLRSRLQERGHRFYTQSDTETLVHLYEEYGEAMVAHLNGMFSFALWDSVAKKLFIARDRVGEKQLFYSFKGGRLHFGSEIKCLLAVGAVSNEIDPVAIDGYLTHLYTPAPRTAYAEISELPPAHTMVVDAGGLRLQRYWDLEYRVDGGRDDQYFVDAFAQKFDHAVRSRLTSDVPLGALLSGGVDSSAIVAAMAKGSSRAVKTFCIGYGSEGNYYDERRYARIVADHFATEHHEFVVEPNVVADLPGIVRAFDQPFGDSSAIVNYYVYRETGKHVKVVLSGLGGDEVAAGYERHLAMKLRKYYRDIPQWVREQVMERAISALPDSKRGGRFVERAKRFVRTGHLPDDRAYLETQATFDARRKHELYTDSFADRLERASPGNTGEEHFNKSGISDVLNRALYSDLMTYLPGDLLPLADRMSMAHSVEGRAPFIDHELIEFMATVPGHLKIKGFEKKHLLKRAFSGVLPHEILHRRKQGFTAPLTVWMRNALQPLIQSTLSRQRIEAVGYFRWSSVSKLLSEHLEGKENHHARIWALLMFMMWHQNYCEAA